MDIVTYVLCRKYAEKLIELNLKGFNFKGTVPNKESLPLSDNAKGDFYIVSDTNQEAVWTSDLSSGTLENWTILGTLQEVDFKDIKGDAKDNESLKKYLDDQYKYQEKLTQENAGNNVTIINDPITGKIKINAISGGGQLPDLPEEDGDYLLKGIVQNFSGTKVYGWVKDTYLRLYDEEYPLINPIGNNNIPDLPNEDGSYLLKCKVRNGVGTVGWLINYVEVVR